MGDLSDKFGAPLLLTLTFAIIISFGKYKSPLYKEASRLADLNGPVPEKRNNGVTGPEEWGQVYNGLGLHYTSGSNPLKDLSSDQLKQYIKNHQ